ncbi:YfjI family protein [Faecalispora jeddahensis]|uniref:YfjI family protein n=1 Tax=Faecalispora jeddahensis TaxID=1414721 RepID=UPI00145BF7CB|nr:YfjI family protein [Faecalispora jeddahensis]
METSEFLLKVYGTLHGGYLSVTTLEKDGKARTKWFDFGQLDEMAAYAVESGKTYNTYFGVNPRVKNLGEHLRGSNKDIAAVIGTYTDFDIKGDAHKEKNLPETKEELMAFLMSLPKVPTAIVESGNGIHTYWLFDEIYYIRNESDRVYAERILKGWESFVKEEAFREYGWKFDSVSDLPRMLRAVGTLNHKTAELPVCKVTSFSENRFSPSDFDEYTSVQPVKKSAGSTETDSFALMGTGSGRELIEKCAFLQHCRDDAENLPEPVWYAAITNLAQTADGESVIHEISSPYPGYTHAETQRKYIHAAQENKPVTCEYIKNQLRFNCGRDCGVKTPVTLVHTEKQAESAWEKPIPFDECTLPEFPVDALPKVIADYVVALAESTQTPVDMAASSALPVISVCIQGKYKVRAKADWYEPVNTFVLNIMEPSERKSAVENAMVRPINKYESEINTQNAAEIESSKMRGRILERRQKALEDQAAKGKDVKAELDSIVQEITGHREKKPLRLYVDDVTTEKLTQVLSDNDGRAAILSTEGGIFDTLAGIYTRNVNIDVILKGYSGDCIKVDRIGRCSESVMDPALTILLMAQPSVLSGLMKNDTFRGRGLTARFLYCIPTSYVGSRKYRSTPVPDEVSRAYETQIRNMLEDEYSKEPEIITLSPESDRMIEAFAGELEPKLKEEYSDISDWAGKLIGNTHRIAGLLCRASVFRSHDFLDVPEPLVIDAATMANAIRIARYFISHAKAAFSLMGADNTVKQSKYVLNAIKNTGLAEFNKRDIMRLCRSFKKADDLQPVLDHLVDYGYIAVKESGVYSGKGRPSAQSYIVNPCIYENEPAS